MIRRMPPAEVLERLRIMSRAKHVIGLKNTLACERAGIGRNYMSNFKNLAKSLTDHMLTVALMMDGKEDAVDWEKLRDRKETQEAHTSCLEVTTWSIWSGLQGQEGREESTELCSEEP